MGWRDVNPSDYEPDDNPLGEFLTGFANVYAPAVVKKAEDERKQQYEIERERRAEARAAARRAASAEAAARRNASAVTAILVDQGLDPARVSDSVRLEVLSRVETFGAGNAASYYADPSRQYTEEWAYRGTSGSSTGAGAGAGADAPVNTGITAPTVVAPSAPSVGSLDPVGSDTEAMLAENDTQGAPAAPVGIDTALPETNVATIQPDPVATATEAPVTTPLRRFRTVTPTIDWSEIDDPSVANEIATDLESKGFTDLANRVRTFGQGRITLVDFASIADMGEEGRAAALADPSYPQQNKDRITNWQAENQRQAGIIPWREITTENYLQYAQDFEASGMTTQADEIRSFGSGPLSRQDPYTLTEIQGLSLPIVDAAIESGQVPDGQMELFQAVSAEKTRDMGRSLVEKEDRELRAIVSATQYYSPTERAAAQAILSSRVDTFNIQDYDDVKDSTIQVIIDSENTSPSVRSQLQQLLANRISEAEPTQYTEADYTSDLIRYGSILVDETSSPAQVAEAERFFTIREPIAAAAFLGAANRATEAKADILMRELNLDRELALKLATGVLDIRADPVTREPTVVDLTSSTIQPTGAPDQIVSELPAGQISLAEDVENPSIVLVDNNGQPIVMTPEMKADAMTTLERIGSLDDPAAAFGPRGWAASIVNPIAGVFGGTVDPEARQAQSALGNLRNVTMLQLVSAFPGIRDSVQLKQQILSLIPETGRFWGSANAAQESMTDIYAQINTAIAAQEGILRSPVQPSDRSKAQVALQALRPLAETYSVLLQGLQDAGNPAAGSTYLGTQGTDAAAPAAPQQPSVSDGFLVTEQMVNAMPEGPIRDKYNSVLGQMVIRNSDGTLTPVGDNNGE